ncbi:VOC family protein [Goodfellowiella coeruleoviolacea]|uniref:Glyoxalase-like domain-containing protein n=1 Tax=Goodfellowiella coeruleoviolacea TaxID=334858 RepID=A0AAE3KH61_9PSEU|nr:VOC family protein [Goodfellowiella coeruleoviolacea]MCP2167976.1 Glyoxalase-like domain-containing protein [Goodfellowiella coeruleoviolacea]
MPQVTGVGGIFLRARKPSLLIEWYREHLGVPMTPHGAVTFHWNSGTTPDRPGSTTLAVFPHDTDYLGEPGQKAMLNLRVDDLTMMLTRLRARGVEVLDQTEDSEYGRFGWCVDPEGNRIELWEPAEGM